MIHVVLSPQVDHATSVTHESLLLFPMCHDVMTGQLHQVFERSIAPVARIFPPFIVQGHVSLEHLIVCHGLVTQLTHWFLGIKVSLEMFEKILQLCEILAALNAWELERLAMRNLVVLQNSEGGKRRVACVTLVRLETCMFPHMHEVVVVCFECCSTDHTS